MKYDMSQAELIEAVQFYLNEKVLRKPVKVSHVKPAKTDRAMGIGYILHVEVTDDQSHVPEEIIQQAHDSKRS